LYLSVAKRCRRYFVAGLWWTCCSGFKLKISSKWLSSRPSRYCLCVCSNVPSV